ncbi:hypothetical protein AB2M62_18075 [Sphingomonas sp. MMS12-HWE2-04]|uniref:hypothetical protein n=1 Tax=Sphingomonas sp. MMS12-HWE2-04 TaxID=3234199 RepID=UPI00384DE293
MIVSLLWCAVIALLGLKVIATLILLRRPPAARIAGRHGLWLWWSTKITPIVAVPCLIAIAAMERDRASLWVFSLLMLFVLVAVPIVVWRRFGRAG